MDNNTKVMFFHQEKDNFEHPFHIKVIITVLSILMILSMFVIKRRLFKFLRRPNKRLLDQIVDFQMSVESIVVVLTLLFYLPLIWAKIPKDYVTELGCYIGPFIFTFIAAYAGIHSFFITIFRYICIIHPNRLSQLNISPEVNGKKLCYFHTYKYHFFHTFLF